MILFLRIEICVLVEFDSLKQEANSEVSFLISSINNKNQIEQIETDKNTNQFCKFLSIGSYIIKVCFILNIYLKKKAFFLAFKI